MNMTDHVTVRWLIKRDMVDVLDIERASFGEMAWGEEDFLACLRQRNCIGMVAERGEEIVGYMVYELLRPRLHLLNLAVRPDVRHSYIGWTLLDKLMDKTAQQRLHEITTEVADDNLGAHLFFQACGFQATHILRNHYENGTDAYRFQWIRPGSDIAALGGRGEL